ncbi:MAG TPA: hypothetical protein VGS80_10855 [Ktedonobacterales bacterium]|nr:hypothetical protein [Ktedonobacterales bacterium]
MPAPPLWTGDAGCGRSPGEAYLALHGADGASLARPEAAATGGGAQGVDQDEGADERREEGQDQPVAAADGEAEEPAANDAAKRADEEVALRAEVAAGHEAVDGGEDEHGIVTCSPALQGGASQFSTAASATAP